MINVFTLVEEKTMTLIKKKVYKGFDQLITVIFDGIDVVIKIDPLDPIWGIKITHMKNTTLSMSLPDFYDKDINIIIENLHVAKEFCDCFKENYDEIIKF